MRKYIYLFATFLTFHIVPLLGQVTVGSELKPESYSILQLEGNDDRGLMLPKITTAQMDALALSLISNAKAKGLVAYNTTDDTIVYWDGAKWVRMIHNIQAVNGVSGNGSTGLKLGGSLTENTVIDQNNNVLNLEFDNNNSSSFKINNTDLVVKMNSVDIKPSGKIDINDKHSILNGSISFDVDSLLVTGDNQALLLDNEGLTLSETTLKLPSKANLGDMLSIDPVNNNLQWSGVRPFSSVLRADIKLVRIPAGQTVVVTDDILLPPGQWLISAKINVRQNRTSGAYLYNWIGISVLDTNNNFIFSSRLGGTLPDMKTSGTVSRTFCYSTPNYTYYYNTNKQVKIQTWVTSSNATSTNNTTTNEQDDVMGESYFYAVRIDVPEEVITTP